MAKNIAAWSKRMKELRVENNLSQTDVAKVLHCSQVAYGMYELGREPREAGQVLPRLNGLPGGAL